MKVRVFRKCETVLENESALKSLVPPIAELRIPSHVSFLEAELTQRLGMLQDLLDAQQLLASRPAEEDKDNPTSSKSSSKSKRKPRRPKRRHYECSEPEESASDYD